MFTGCKSFGIWMELEAIDLSPKVICKSLRQVLMHEHSIKHGLMTKLWFKIWVLSIDLVKIYVLYFQYLIVQQRVHEPIGANKSIQDQSPNIL